VPSPFRKSPPWHMKSLICETRNVISAAVLRNIVLASPGNYPIRGLEGYDGVERREKGERGRRRTIRWNLLPL